jgi:hypothetical protein
LQDESAESKQRRIIAELYDGEWHVSPSFREYALIADTRLFAVIEEWTTKTMLPGYKA